jgi:two-component system, OmpR family, sensor histidine kinase CiaH
MKKLKKKIFWVMFCMLTIFLISILCIFIFQDYNHEKTEIENKLSRMENNKEKPLDNMMLNGQSQEQNENDDKSDMQYKTGFEDDDKAENVPVVPVFMDATIYTIKYNTDNEITEILNYTQNSISEDEIRQVAQGILESSSKKSGIEVKNLYFNQYSYAFEVPNTLTIIDNSSVKAKLESLLRTSMIIFILVEIAIVVISIKITGWLIKPVEETFNKQKQFVADASHELKTPIAIIMANAEALEKEPEEKKWLNNIKGESERMNELVTNLLDLAKLEEVKDTETYSEEDLSKIVEMSVLTFESLMFENQIELKYDIQKDIKMNCNNSQIKQLVAILLDNAIKHSVEGGEIQVLLKKQKSDIFLSVSNKGKDIPKDMQDKIFERFYRADESRNRDSNRYGLGLAIAKNIVENHKGKISVDSEKGITTFKVLFK